LVVEIFAIHTPLVVMSLSHWYTDVEMRDASISTNTAVLPVLRYDT